MVFWIPRMPKHIRKKAASVDDDVLATACDLAMALHRVGAMTDREMREMDKLCLTRCPEYDGAEGRYVRAEKSDSAPAM